MCVRCMTCRMLRVVFVRPLCQHSGVVSPHTVKSLCTGLCMLSWAFLHVSDVGVLRLRMMCTLDTPVWGLPFNRTVVTLFRCDVQVIQHRVNRKISQSWLLCLHLGHQCNASNSLQGAATLGRSATPLHDPYPSPNSLHPGGSRGWTARGKVGPVTRLHRVMFGCVAPIDATQGPRSEVLAAYMSQRRAALAVASPQAAWPTPKPAEV